MGLINFVKRTVYFILSFLYQVPPGASKRRGYISYKNVNKKNSSNLSILMGIGDWLSAINLIYFGDWKNNKNGDWGLATMKKTDDA